MLTHLTGSIVSTLNHRSNMKVIAQISASTMFTLGQWVLLLVFTRFYGADKFAQYAYYMAVLAPIFMFFDMKLRNIVASSSSSEFSDSDFIIFKYIVFMISVLIGSVFVSISTNGSAEVVAAVIILKSTDSISTFVYGFWQREREEYKIVASLLVRSLMFSSVFLYYAFGLEFSEALLAVSLKNAVLLTVNLMVIERKRKGAYTITYNQFKKLMSVGAILGAVQFLISLRTNTPFYFMETSVESYVLGVYSAFHYIIVAISRLPAALFNSRLAAITGDVSHFDLKGLIQKYLEILIFSISLCLCLYIFAGYSEGEILGKIIGEEYGLHWVHLSNLLVGAPFLYTATYIIHSLIAFGQKLPQFVIAIINLFFVLCIFFTIPNNNSLDYYTKAIVISNVFYFFTTACWLVFSVLLRSRKLI